MYQSSGRKSESSGLRIESSGAARRSSERRCRSSVTGLSGPHTRKPALCVWEEERGRAWEEGGRANESEGERCRQLKSKDRDVEGDRKVKMIYEIRDPRGVPSLG